MTFAHTLMVFILIVSTGVLAAGFIFWFNAGKLEQDKPKDTDPGMGFADTLIEFAKWETTLVMR